MNIIEPVVITESMVVANNLVNDDIPLWQAGTTYAADARVIYGTSIYRAVQGTNVGKNPATDVMSTWWLRIGATNRFRAFDLRLGGKATGGPTMVFRITLPRTLNAICLFGLNATSVHILVRNALNVVTHTRVITLAKRDPVGNAWEYVYNPFIFKTDLIVRGLPLPSGSTVEIRINGGSFTEVGEVFIGNDLHIGTTLVESGLGIQDFSKKERDEWGGVYLVPRATIKTATFRFSFPTSASKRVQEIVQRVASKICVFYAIDGEDRFGLTVAGVLRDYDITLSSGTSDGTIQAESLT